VLGSQAFLEGAGAVKKNIGNRSRKTSLEGAGAGKTLKNGCQELEVREVYIGGDPRNL
jgi:hypothetical protein